MLKRSARQNNGALLGLLPGGTRCILASGEARRALMNTSAFSLEGALSILAALKAGRREVLEILIDDGKRFDQRLVELRLRAKQAAVNLKYVTSAEIEAYATGNSHGGVIALAGRKTIRMCRRFDPRRTSPRSSSCSMALKILTTFGFAVRALYTAWRRWPGLAQAQLDEAPAPS